MPAWDKLPESIRNEQCYEYYLLLKKRNMSIFFKRVFDLFVSSILLVILFLPMLLIAILIKLDSKGPALFKQERVTNFGRHFHIHKFRTMKVDTEKNGQLTVGNDSRITKMGAYLRKRRLDEIPQLIDILLGNMSFVGARPEVPKYVSAYSDEMLATLLLPAGVTSDAAIEYKDEAKILEQTDVDIDKCYIEQVLPEKMRINLQYLKNFNFKQDIRIIYKTVVAVLFG